MNNLSWFLYLAEVFPRLSALGFVLGLVTCLLMLCFIDPMFTEGSKKAGKPILTGLLLTFVFSVTLAVFIPSKDTIYLIAASEAGEMVVKTPEAQEVLSDLKEILNVQLEKLKQ